MDKRVLNAIFEKVENEPYANKLGMKLLKLDYGYSLVEMHFTEDVANIFGIPHGGAIFSWLMKPSKQPQTRMVQLL